jgi:hypothetical protein
MMRGFLLVGIHTIYILLDLRVDLLLLTHQDGPLCSCDCLITQPSLQGWNLGDLPYYAHHHSVQSESSLDSKSALSSSESSFKAASCPFATVAPNYTLLFLRFPVQLDSLEPQLDGCHVFVCLNLPSKSIF